MCYSPKPFIFPSPFLKSMMGLKIWDKEFVEKKFGPLYTGPMSTIESKPFSLITNMGFIEEESKKTCSQCGERFIPLYNWSDKCWHCEQIERINESGKRLLEKTKKKNYLL